jgi:hypothetical protein
MISGAMLIRHPDGAAHTRIHAAKIDCQAAVRLSEDNEERQSALCMMSAHEGKGITGTMPFVGGIDIEKKEEGQIYGCRMATRDPARCRQVRHLFCLSRLQI